MVCISHINHKTLSLERFRLGSPPDASRGKRLYVLGTMGWLLIAGTSVLQATTEDATDWRSQRSAPGTTPETGPMVEVRRALPVEEFDALETAMKSGDGSTVDGLFAAGISPEAPLSCGDPPLVWAARAQRPELVATCLDWCARTATTGADGLSALALATVTGQREVAAALVEAGADPNQALPEPAPEVVRNAFEAGWFREQLRYDKNLTPLMFASVLGDEELVRTMLDHGGRPYQRTTRYTTDSLVLACRAGHIRVAQAAAAPRPGR